MPAISYKKIVRRALDITWRNKFLWILGLFLFSFSNYNFLNILIGAPAQDPKWSRGVNTELFYRTLTEKPLMVALVLAVSLLFIFLFLYLGAVAKAGVILSADRIEKKEKPGLRKAIKEGRNFSWRLIGVSIAAASVLLLAGVLLLVPVYYLYDSGLVLRAAMLGGLAVIIYIPLFFIVSFTAILSSNFVVLGELNLSEALASGFDLFTRYWVQIILFSFLVLFMNAVLAFVFILALGTATLPFLLLNFLLGKVLAQSLMNALLFFGAGI